MNARNVPAMFVAMALAGNVFAETEISESAEPEAAVVETSASESVLSAASQSAVTDLKAGTFLSSPDFRNTRIADGMFDEPSSAAFKMFGAGMFIAAGADLASTEYGLSRPGVYEVNPVQGNRNLRLLTHAAVPAFMYFVTDKLHDKGKTKLALLARIGFTVGYSYVVMHNMRTAALAP